MPILLPHPSPLAKPVRQVSQEELQILIRRRECLFERVVKFTDSWLLGSCSFLDRLVEEPQVPTGVGEVSRGVELPARLDVAGDDLCGVQGLDEIEGAEPSGVDGRGFDFFRPGVMKQ